MTKRERICIVIISIVLAILIGLMMSLANARAAPGCPPMPTPTQLNAVTLVEFSTDSNADFTTGVIVGLALTLVCIGMLVWLRQRGKAESA